MPATAAKYLDMQEATITIPANSLYGSVVITHNLAKQHDDGVTYDYVDPDFVCPEFISVASEQNSPWFEVKHPVTPNGTLTIECHIAATQGAPITVVTRVTSIYWHSVQGTDHTA